MNTQKHTKGPWIVANSGGDVIAGKFPKLKSICILELVPLKISEEVAANAKLIAAAPELLKVCTDLLNAFVHKENDKKGNQTRTDIFKYCPEFREIAVAARTAINKATE